MKPTKYNAYCLPERSLDYTKKAFQRRKNILAGKPLPFWSSTIGWMILQLLASAAAVILLGVIK